MSTQQEPLKKRHRTEAKPWKRAFFRFSEDQQETTLQEKEIEEGLEKIYSDSSDLKEMQQESRFWWLRWFVGISLVLASLSVLAWLGFGIIQPNNKPIIEALAVTIDGPDQLIVGKETEYAIRYKNTSLQTVQGAALRIGIPPVLQVTYMDPWPIDPKTNTWTLGLLGSGSEGVIKIRAIPYGEIGDTTALQAVMTADDSGEVKVKESLVTKALTMQDAVLKTTWLTPARIVAGEQVAIELQLAHTDVNAIKEAHVDIRYPESFVLSSSTASGTTLFTKLLPTIEPAATSVIRLVGTFVSNSNGTQDFEAVVTQKVKDVSITLAKSKTQVPVLASDLSLQLVVNGGTGDKTIQPGEMIRTTLAYANTSPETLSDVVLKVSYESVKNGSSATGTSFLDWSKVDDSGKGVTSTKTRIQTITYTKAQIPELAELKTGERGTVDISLPSTMVTTSTKDALIRIQVQGSIAKAAGKEVKRTIITQPIGLRYRSDVLAIGYARYYTEEGAPLGSGPLPPVVGKATTYRLYWSLDKKLHSLEGVTVKAVLPENVRLTGKQEIGAGVLNFDSKTRTVSWEMNAMPDDVYQLDAWFDLELTPGSLDSGRFASLLKPAEFLAKDTLLNEEIRQSLPEITTDLEEDEGAKGKGVVKKP